jgi:hypothetical protein
VTKRVRAKLGDAGVAGQDPVLEFCKTVQKPYLNVVSRVTSSEKQNPRNCRKVENTKKMKERIDGLEGSKAIAKPQALSQQLHSHSELNTRSKHFLIFCCVHSSLIRLDHAFTMQIGPIAPKNSSMQNAKGKCVVLFSRV